MELTLRINGKNKTFVADFVSARVLRNALKLMNEMDMTNLKPEELDTLINFTCDVFNKQFTFDELYDGLEASKLMDTLSDVILYSTGRSVDAEDEEDTGK